VAGTPLTDGQKVEVYYSAGPMIVKEKVPNLVGLNFATAMKRLDDLDFSNIRVEREESDEAKDTVIAQSVKANAEIDITEEIVLTISKGPGVKKAVVPQVVGSSFKDALSILNGYGFTNIEEEYVDSDKPYNEVVYQSIAQGTEIDVTTKIILRLSKGPKETEPPEEQEKPEVTKNVTIELPTDRTESYVVSLHLSGKPVISDRTVEPDTKSIDVSLTGSGTQHFDLYINGTYYKTIKVEFS
jgi:beta-lactam-binding protein with PASTA domain